MLVEEIKGILKIKEQHESKARTKGYPPPSTEKFHRRLADLIKKVELHPRQAFSVEMAFLIHERRPGLTPDRETNLNRAHKESQLAERFVIIMEKNPDQYVKAAERHFSTPDKQINGVPRDPVQEFCKNQIVRLSQQRMASLHASTARRELLAARRSLMLRTQGRYTQMQKVVMAKSHQYSKTQSREVALSI